MWIGALLWLWCAMLGGHAPRGSSERFVSAGPDLQLRTALAPLKIEGVERLATPKPRGRWTPTTNVGSATVATLVLVVAPRARVTSARAAAPRPRRLALSYDATAPPTAL
jgi:hypothetical protein